MRVHYIGHTLIVLRLHYQFICRRPAHKGKGKGGKTAFDGSTDANYGLPSKPPVAEPSAEEKEKIEVEKRKIECRNALRSATTEADVEAALVIARELDLANEVRIGETKLAKIRGDEED